MGNFSAWTSPLVLLALLVQGGIAITLTAIPAATSLTTYTSTYSATVTNTITSIVPVTTTQTTCTPGTTAPLDYQCTNSAWSSNGVYWQELCTTASLQGPTWLIYVGTSPQVCRNYCNVYSGLCAAVNFNPINRLCTLLRSVTATAAVSSIGYAAMEKFTTNPCIVTSTGSSTQLSIETAVVEQTTTITATITLSTSTSSPSPTVAASSAVSSAAVTTPTASACTVSTLATLPTTSKCVDGYYQHDGYYYQVLCDQHVASYGGFDIPNSGQDDIWDCIEICSQYSDCVGTFWFGLEGICVSPSSSLEYDYIPYDYEDPDNNIIEYIAMRLDGNPCPASSSSVSLIQSSDVPSSVVVSSSAHTSASIVTSAAAVSSSAHTSASIISSAAAVSSSAHTSASIATSSSAIVPPSSVSVGVSSSTPLSRSSSTPLIRPTVTISPHSTAPSTAPSSVRASSSSGVAPAHSNSLTVSSPAALSTPASSVPIHSVSVPSVIASSVSNPAVSVSSASATATSAISLTSTGVSSAPASSGAAPPSGAAPSETAPSGTAPPGTAPSGTTPSGTSPSGSEPSGSQPSGSESTGGEPSGNLPSGHESSGSVASTVVSHEHGNEPTGSPGNTAISGSNTDTSALMTATQTAGQASTTAPPKFTTSTVFTTDVHTITACPASVTDCPAREQTTYTTTETIAAYTTICPITAEETGAGAKPTGVAGSNGQHESLTTSTVFTTQVHPTTVCPSHIKNCAGSQKTTSLVTETVIAYVTVCPVAEAEATSMASLQAPSHNQDTATTLTIATYITETATLATTYKTVNAGSTVEKSASYISTTVIPVTKTVVVTGTETIDVSPTYAPNGSSAQGSVGNESGVSGQDNVQAGAQHSPHNISHSTIASSSAFISSTTKSTQTASAMVTGFFTEASATTSPAFNGVASKTASWSLSSLFALAVVGYLSW